MLCCIFITIAACNASTIKSTKKPITRIVNAANTQIITEGVISWFPYYSSQFINQGCNWDDPNGTCQNDINAFTLNTCQILTHFNTPVCGGQTCFFNSTTGMCGGQCQNTILETCVSQVENPSEDSDCVCARSVASWTSNYNNRTNVLTNNVPTCDASTCYGNPCAFRYVSVNRKSDGVLRGFCTNARVSQSVFL